MSNFDYTLQILCIFFLCEEAKKILNSLQRKRRKAKENSTYKNHWKVSKSCNPQLELWMQWNWVSYLVLFVSKVFFYYLIFWEKVNFCVKCSEMVIFEPKCHQNGDFKVTFSLHSLHHFLCKEFSLHKMRRKFSMRRICNV